MSIWRNAREELERDLDELKRQRRELVELMSLMKKNFEEFGVKRPVELKPGMQVSCSGAQDLLRLCQEVKKGLRKEGTLWEHCDELEVKLMRLCDRVCRDREI